MRVCISARLAARSLLVAALALAFMPLSAGDADARRVKLRNSRAVDETPNRPRDNDDDTRLRLRVVPGSSGQQNEEQRAERTTPLTRAEAAAERARAALAAEEVSTMRKPLVVPLPTTVATPKGYNHGAMCVAGC